MTEQVFNHTAHKALWNWLAKHPTKTKLDWPGWEWNGGKSKYALYFCFACEYSYKICGGCFHCPLDWENPISCGYDGGLFFKWKNVSKNSHRTRKRLALQIANLPVRKGVKCI